MKRVRQDASYGYKVQIYVRTSCVVLSAELTEQEKLALYVKPSLGTLICGAVDGTNLEGMVWRDVKLDRSTPSDALE